MTELFQPKNPTVDYDEELQPIHWAILTAFLLVVGMVGLVQLIF